MVKKTYTSVVKRLLEEGKEVIDIIEALKVEFPEANSSKMISKLKPTIKYLKGKVSEK